MHSDDVYTVLEAIAKVGSTNQKQHILRQVPQSKKVLYYAYNSFKTYHVRDISPVGKGTNSLGNKTWTLLDSLDSGRYSGDTARRNILAYGESLSGPSAILFSRILQRDMRIGMNVKTINSVFPGLIPTHDVMLAQKVNWKKVKFPCYSSIKLDGVRGLYRDGVFYTRSGKVLVGLDHLVEQLVGAPPLDGEIMVAGESLFDKASGRIRSYDKVPDAVFHVFDSPERDYEFTHFLQGLGRIGEAENLANVKLVQHKVVNNQDEALAHYAECRNAGFEGTVLKPIDYQYQQKRSADWMKLKAIESEDLPCVGFFEGTGKYVGMLGGIVVERNGVQIRVGGGFSDQERKDLWGQYRGMLGKIAEVLYHEVTADGSFRHPRFLRWRPDK